jgi:hypothetical protein
MTDRPAGIRRPKTPLAWRPTACRAGDVFAIWKTPDMNQFRKVCAAAATAAAVATSPAAGAAVIAPGLDALEPQSRSAPLLGHRLDVEMTVRNWVLCASQPVAEMLVRARQQGRDAAEKAYVDLASARSCGRLAEMQVILQEPLYDALIGVGGHAGVYGALINISGEWASGFVVYGGVPED